VTPEELSKAESDALLDLAHGKYDEWVKGVDLILGALAKVIPAVGIAKGILDGAIALNKVTAPLKVALGEAGSFVDIHNSRVNPDGSLRPYDPAKDG
jgi:hypothetical protein